MKNDRVLTLVAKIGSSSITNHDGVISHAAIEKLCAEVAAVRRRDVRCVVVTSGAIAAGLPELGLGGARRPKDSVTLQAVSAVGQGSLIGVYKTVALDDSTPPKEVATAAYDVNVYKSARNIEGVCVSAVADLNALSVLQPRKLLVTKDALDAFKARVPAAK